MLNIKIIMGFILAFTIGVVCRLTHIPLPAPPNLLGALLILFITSGYLTVDYYLSHKHTEGKLPRC